MITARQLQINDAVKKAEGRYYTKIATIGYHSDSDSEMDSDDDLDVFEHNNTNKYKGIREQLVTMAAEHVISSEIYLAAMSRVDHEESLVDECWEANKDSTHSGYVKGSRQFDDAFSAQRMVDKFVTEGLRKYDAAQMEKEARVLSAQEAKEQRSTSSAVTISDSKVEPSLSSIPSASQTQSSITGDSSSAASVSVSTSSISPTPAVAHSSSSPFGLFSTSSSIVSLTSTSSAITVVAETPSGEASASIPVAQIPTFR